MRLTAEPSTQVPVGPDRRGPADTSVLAHVCFLARGICVPHPCSAGELSCHQEAWFSSESPSCSLDLSLCRVWLASRPS